MKEKTADEMFEELGYKKKNLDIIFSRFWEEWENEDLAKTFSFNTEYKTIDITDENGYGITMQELQAINKKVEELRMARVKKIIQTIKLHKFKTEVNKKIIEEMDESGYLVWYKDGTCKEVNFKDDLIDILSKDHIKPIRYIFNMSDRIIVDRKIYINTEEVF